jgi:hypothetical protein
MVWRSREHPRAAKLTRGGTFAGGWLAGDLAWGRRSWKKQFNYE